jgi:N-acetylmuramoyl-L-alanine amidase
MTGESETGMPLRVLIRAVFTALLVLGLAAVCLASARDDYARGVSAFNSLLKNEKRAGLRSEWLAVMKHFERSLSADSKGSLAPKCMYFIGRTREELARRSFSRADRESALVAFDRMLAAYPKHGWADDALFRKGMIWLEQGKNKVQAEGVFKGVLALYPLGDMAPKATEMLAVIVGSKGPPAPAKAAARPRAESTLTGIRHWSGGDYTRVVMDMSHDVKYERALVEKASDGNKQLQITLQRTDVSGDVAPSRSIQDGILSNVHIVSGSSGDVLITVDLMHMDHYRVFTLPEPYRVVLDVYGSANGGDRSVASVAPGEVDHVQAALDELKAKRLNGAGGAKDASKAAAKPAAPGKNSAASKPQIKVSEKQKKYTGSLVEQLGLKVGTIMIDAGHGGKDPGAVANGLYEKDINLRMAKILGRELQKQGFKVHYTRTNDTFIPLEERTARANAKNADLFISVHCNAHKKESVKGFEVYYLNLATDAQAVRVSAKKISDMQFILSDLMLNSKINESRQMAAMVEDETLKYMRPRHSLASHGAKGAFFYVLTGARMPSILVELGYLTNAAEASRLKSEAYLEAMARGLTSGVLSYKKKLERFALNSSGKS